MEKYKIKYILIAAISLIPAIYTFFPDFPFSRIDLWRGFFLGIFGYSFGVLFSKKRDFHKMFLYTCLVYIVSFFLRFSPGIADLLGLSMAALGSLFVYLIALRFDKNMAPTEK
jgi:predicted membrane channel-forming protein YqfA (hemolysin III family)